MEDAFSYYNNQKQQILASDIKKYTQKRSFALGIQRYFEDKTYERIHFTEEDLNEVLIMSFIKNYYVNKIGHPNIKDARMSIALYQSIINNWFETIDSLSNTENVRDFLLRNYIGNFDNYTIDEETYDFTNMLLKEYVSYKKNEKKKTEKSEKKLVKQKESE